MDNIEQDHLTELDLNIDSDVRQQLNEAAKWTKFISIVMFVICGFLLLIGVLGGAAILTLFERFGTRYNLPANFGGGLLILVMVIFVGIIGVIYYFLFNFSQKIKASLLADNTADLNAGLKSLKLFFIITTVFAVLSLLNSIVQMVF